MFATQLAALALILSGAANVMAATESELSWIVPGTRTMETLYNVNDHIRRMMEAGKRADASDAANLSRRRRYVTGTRTMSTLYQVNDQIRRMMEAGKRGKRYVPGTRTMDTLYETQETMNNIRHMLRVGKRDTGAAAAKRYVSGRRTMSTLYEVNDRIRQMMKAGKRGAAGAAYTKQNGADQLLKRIMKHMSKEEFIRMLNDLEEDIASSKDKKRNSFKEADELVEKVVSESNESREPLN